MLSHLPSIIMNHLSISHLSHGILLPFMVILLPWHSAQDSFEGALPPRVRRLGLVHAWHMHVLKTSLVFTKIGLN